MSIKELRKKHKELISKGIIIVAITLFCSNANANVSKTYEIKDHIEANFKTMIWYDGGRFFNKEYTEDDIWNTAHQLVDINFYIFQEKNENKAVKRKILTQYIYNNHKQWINEAYNTAEEMIKMESEENNK